MVQPFSNFAFNRELPKDLVNGLSTDCSPYDAVEPFGRGVTTGTEGLGSVDFSRK
jgi:hypothetical protein